MSEDGLLVTVATVGCLLVVLVGIVMSALVEIEKAKGQTITKAEWCQGIGGTLGECVGESK